MRLIPLAFQAAVELPEARSIRVECIDGHGTTGIGVGIRLAATTVGAIAN
jgi:hypothetical protein